MKAPITKAIALFKSLPIFSLIAAKAIKNEKAERGLVMVKRKAERNSSMKPIALSSLTFFSLGFEISDIIPKKKSKNPPVISSRDLCSVIKAKMTVILKAPTEASRASAKAAPRPDTSPEARFLDNVLCIQISPTGPTGTAMAKPIKIPQLSPKADSSIYYCFDLSSLSRPSFFTPKYTTKAIMVKFIKILINLP